MWFTLCLSLVIAAQATPMAQQWTQTFTSASGALPHEAGWTKSGCDACVYSSDGASHPAVLHVTNEGTKSILS
jgi:hypothetical protein